MTNTECNFPDDPCVECENCPHCNDCYWPKFLREEHMPNCKENPANYCATCDTWPVKQGLTDCQMHDGFGVNK